MPIAKSKDQLRRDKTMGLLKTVGISGALGMAGGVGGLGAGLAFSKDVVANPAAGIEEMLKPHFTSKTMPGIGGSPMGGGILGAFGANYNPTEHTISTPGNAPSFIGFHEAGHAINVKKMGRLLTHLYMGSRMLSPLSPMYSMFKAWKGEDDKYGPLRSAAVGLPMVAEEGLASWRALEHIKKMKGIAARNRNIPTALGQVGGYLAGGMIVPALTSYLADKFMNKKKLEG